jgi:acetyl-CoA carboxylase biotin carboxyl carrier protein
MPAPDPTGPLDRDAANELWDRTHALITRLEGTSVQRLRLQMGTLEIEVERAVAQPGAAPAPLAASVAGAVPDGATPDLPDHRHGVKAPLVGAFYRSPKLGGAPFVEVGDVVEAGQPVCIVEAMKVMNQVVTTEPGRVAEILVDNGDYVEFDQVLMYVEPLEAS